MAKGPILTPRVTSIIASLHKRHPKWKAPEIRNIVDDLLHKEDPTLPKGWPSLSSVQKILAVIRKKEAKPDPQDEPWSIASLSKYPIAPEAMPVVMSFYKKRLAENSWLSIREALWAARLFKIVDPLELVFDWAFLYAFNEMASEGSGKPFESKQTDLGIIDNPQNIHKMTRVIDIWTIAMEYDADLGKLLDLDLSIEETEEIAKSGKYKKEGQNERKHKTKKQK